MIHWFPVKAAILQVNYPSLALLFSELVRFELVSVWNCYVQTDIYKCESHSIWLQDMKPPGLGNSLAINKVFSHLQKGFLF